MNDMASMHIPDEVSALIETINVRGYEAFVVGGCVRDSLLGHVPEDWDIATSASPEDIKKIFRHTVDTGILHGTVTVVMQKKHYEVTTYRVDGLYTDGRHPENVTFTNRLDEDLRRRDFTMNAIAYHEQTGFVDPYHGMEDIRNQIIRGVGDPAERFQEDALRMLRALRFSAQLDFRIEENTFTALCEKASLLRNVSMERVRDEMRKLLLSDHTEKLALLRESGLLPHMYPSLPAYFDEYLHRVLPPVLHCEKNVPKRFALLLRFWPEQEVHALMKHFRFDNRTIGDTLLIVRWLTYWLTDDAYDIRRLLSVMGHEAFQQLLDTKKCIPERGGDPHGQPIQVLENVSARLHEIIRRNDCCSLKALRINGNDLKKMGVWDGREIGRILSVLLDEVMREPEKNEEETLRKLATEWL